MINELERTKSCMNTYNDLNTQLKQELEKLEIEKGDLIEEKNLILLKIADIENEKLILENEVIPTLKEENLRLTKLVDEDKTVITNLKELMKEKSEQNDKLSQDNDAEKVTLTNKCQVLEENLTQAELNLDKRNAEINELKKQLEICISDAKQRETELQENNKTLLEQYEEKEMKIHKLIQDLKEERATMSRCEQELQSKEIRVLELKQRLNMAETENREVAQNEKLHFTEILKRKDEECELLRNENNEWKIKMDALEVEFKDEKNSLQDELQTQITNNEQLAKHLELTLQQSNELNNKLFTYNNEITELKKEINDIKNEKDKILSDNNLLIQENNKNIVKLNEVQKDFDVLQNELTLIKKDNVQLKSTVVTYETEITNLEKVIQKVMKQNDLFKENIDNLDIDDKCRVLQEYIIKIEQVLEQRRTEINALKEEIKIVTSEAKVHETDLKQKNEMLTKNLEEKDDVILKINQELAKEKILNCEYQKQVQLHQYDISELEKKLSKLKDGVDRNWEIDTSDVDRIGKCDEVEARGPALQPHPDTQVHSSSSDTHSNTEKNKIISDLERILNDKNRTISNLNSDITYLKSMMAESESEVLDKNKELESSRENCQQLSLQLKKIVHQKNEEIMDLKRQITKMSLTENRASQIIKVSARYQEIIQKRIAEIKSDTVLKELTNYGNATNGDLKRSLNSGSITMEDLENFLETTDRHLRRCAEKRAALQKERDRLLEVNRINESDVINIKKFLTELSVSVKTFNSYKEMYSQKLSRVILLQRTVRREILKVEERLCEEARCKLERTYAAVMQDLVECALNLERWVERCVARAFSSEKMKQAFMSDLDRASLASASFQSAALEAQIDELENSFQKVLEEVARALKGDGGAGGRRAVGGGGTVAEVRAEYEDKLTRMKAKMKELYSQEIEVFKERQRREVEALERELSATRARLAETSGAYEEHIRGLTSEMWRLGERLVERDEDRPRALRAPSLMSLQQMPSSGAATHAEDRSRASDTHSLRSLPVNINNKKKEGRGLHMSDEEGEVFDNRYLRELRSPGEAARGGGVGRASELATPRGRGDPVHRLSELRWRNSLCLPHLKSSYPAETQFVAAHEDDIKAVPANATVGGRQQRKEVGITAYKKPGPPTPSKQAGRLSATDCELRESLRVEAEPHGAGGGAQAGRRTATPSRLRALFTSNRSDAVDGTPRSRRLSNFFRKK
ncbi:PREDICTED: interaptin-like [Papilio xuthus]|uniref:Interaptin-like n=1 Tax=Papilio xuthus TaxID=66420 RepID=A0AAJ6Z1A9_PAPXU|nr:PREDICTED: interaptin-like [Papilio xuthus]